MGSFGGGLGDTGGSGKSPAIAGTPEHGNQNGGGGVIRVAKNNTLVIRQTQKVHDEIIELLDQLK
jgi:hypothetical protein